MITVEEIKKILATGDIKKSISLSFDLSTNSDSFKEYQDEIIILSREYYDIEKKERMGLPFSSKDLNRITLSLLKILNKLNAQEEPKIKKSSYINPVFKNILEIRNLETEFERRVRFEQSIREVETWDLKPSIIQTKDEQSSLIYRYANNNYYFEFSGNDNITSYQSKEWQGFIKNIKTLKDSITCIFLTLGSIEIDVYKDANQLNSEGKVVGIIDFDDWEGLSKSRIKFIWFLEYLMNHCKLYQLSKLSNIKEALGRIEKIQIAEGQLKEITQLQSSIFLRRFKHPLHEKIYVKRNIDSQLIQNINNLRPSKLRNIHRDRIEENDEVNQICILRDLSGSGKTTFAVNTTLPNPNFFGTGITADEIGVDRILDKFIASFDSKLGLSKLILCNKPIVFVTDSLDEASQNLEKKRRELISLLGALKQLNKEANKFGLPYYPILLVFTVRETFWRDWENIFEGRKRMNVLRKRISNFNSSELREAIYKYSLAYGYEIFDKKMKREAEQTLSVPINLQIFSEANQYRGKIHLEEVWKDNVIDLYFDRKQQDVYKRNIVGFSSRSFMKVVSSIARFLIEKRKNQIRKIELYNLFQRKFLILLLHADDILETLTSERILIKDIKEQDTYRFKHSRFIEYLMAYFIVGVVDAEKKTTKLGKLTSLAFDSGIVSMFRVHDDIRFISKNKFPKTEELILNHYAGSESFLKRKLSSLRAFLSGNKESRNVDLELILKNNSSHSPEIAWESYFVFSAKRNVSRIEKDKVLGSFLVAWNSNNENRERWKLLIKLRNSNLLMNEKIFVKVMDSNVYKEWEVYLGLVYESQKNSHFSELWEEYRGSDVLDMHLKGHDGYYWEYIQKLVNAILQNKRIILGDFR